jgi:hypothetical protein
LTIGGFAAMSLRADDKKEVTLKGTIVCAKCPLKETKKCTTAIQVKEGDKLVTYCLDDKGTAESYHEAVCGGEKKEGTVVGVVTEKDSWTKPLFIKQADKEAREKRRAERLELFERERERHRLNAADARRHKERVRAANEQLQSAKSQLETNASNPLLDQH